MDLGAVTATERPELFMREAALDVAAQQVSFGPGLYVVTLSTTATLQSGGLLLPCVRLDPLPSSQAAPGMAYLACLNEGNWLTGNGKAGFLRVTGGQAALMLTTYNPSGGGQPPQVRIRLVPDDAAALSAVAPPASTLADLQTTGEVPSLNLVVHCSDEASKVAGSGEWVEASGPNGFIEAFCVHLTAGFPLTLDYQAIMGVDWVSPWAVSPNLCGSVGLGLAIFGLRMRLQGAQAEAFEVVLWGRSGMQQAGPITTGELAFGVGQPLTAMKVELRPATPLERRPRRPLRPRADPPNP